MISAGGSRRHLQGATETAAGKDSMVNVPPVAKRNVSSPGGFSFPESRVSPNSPCLEFQWQSVTLPDIETGCILLAFQRSPLMFCQAVSNGPLQPETPPRPTSAEWNVVRGVCCQRRSQRILTSCGGRRDLSKKPGRGVHPQAGRHSTRSGTGRAEQCVPQWTIDWIVGISPGFGRDHAGGRFA